MLEFFSWDHMELIDYFEENEQLYTESTHRGNKYSILVFFFFFPSLPHPQHPQHVEVPGLGIEPEPQLHPVPWLWQCWILNSLRQKGTSILVFLCVHQSCKVFLM